MYLDICMTKTWNEAVHKIQGEKASMHNLRYVTTVLIKKAKVERFLCDFLWIKKPIFESIIHAWKPFFVKTTTILYHLWNLEFWWLCKIISSSQYQCLSNINNLLPCHFTLIVMRGKRTFLLPYYVAGQHTSPASSQHHENWWYGGKCWY